MADSTPRVLLHIDMDAFYAAVEVREDPSLRGLPVIVGHRGRRGVVTTCTYEARRFGVRSAMPSMLAERLCPDAVWIGGRMELYAAVSRRIRRILERFSPVVEPLSIDEAFLDLGGIAPDLEEGARTARAVKRAIAGEESLTASVGVAPNPFLAKLASDLEKPDGLVVLSLDDLPQRVWPLPIERLWGVGPKTAVRLRRAGLTRIGDVLQVDERSLAAVVGDGAASHLRQLARGIDGRRLGAHRAARTISEERTYTDDLTDPGEIDGALLRRADGLARELRREGLVARTVHLKVRLADFTTWTRARTLIEPTDLTEPIVAAARALLRERIDLGGRGIRLLGVGVSGLDAASRPPGRLFPDPAEERARRLARASDAVRQRVGEGAVTRAGLLRPPARER